MQQAQVFLTPPPPGVWLPCSVLAVLLRYYEGPTTVGLLQQSGYTVFLRRFIVLPIQSFKLVTLYSV